MAAAKSEFERVMRERNAFEDKLLVKAWDDEKFKKQLLADPSGVIEKETGQDFPKGCKFEVIQEAANTFELVLPHKPRAVQASEELSDQALEHVAGGAVVLAGGRTWNFLVSLTTSTDHAYFVLVGADEI
jgi:hypothetical protein